MKHTFNITSELRSLLKILSDSGYKWLMRDPGGDLYAYQQYPHYVPEEDYYDTDDSKMHYLSKGVCDMMILDHDLDIPEGVDYFADITPEQPVAISDLLV